MGTFQKRIAQLMISILAAKMSSKKSCTNAGTNQSGNNYRAYSDGGYSYSNKGSSGNTTSTYYNTGAGHSFYSSKTGGYNVHTNQNTGTSTYSSTSSSKK